jgi:cytokinesis protein
MELEDEERRREKRQQMAAQAQAKQAARNDPLAPAIAQGTGAMDALLNKLRAAGPSSRDKREARRRARLRQNGAIRAVSITKDADTEGDGENQNEKSTVAASSDAEQAPMSPDITVTSADQAADEDSLTKRTEEMLMRLRGDSGEVPTVLGKGSIRDKRKERRRRNGSNVSMSSTNSGSISLSLTSPPVPPIPANIPSPTGGLTALGPADGEEQIARAKNALMAMRRGSDAGSIGSGTSERTAPPTEQGPLQSPISIDSDESTPTTVVSPPSPERALSSNP